MNEVERDLLKTRIRLDKVMAAVREVVFAYHCYPNDSVPVALSEAIIHLAIVHDEEAG